MERSGALEVPDEPGESGWDLARCWDSDHHDGVPVFVPTHAAPDGEPPGHVRFVTDGIESCVARPKAAAGDRDVMLHGASTAQECLRVALLDEMEIQLVPYPRRGGQAPLRRPWTRTHRTRADPGARNPGVMHLRYRVQRSEQRIKESE